MNVTSSVTRRGIIAGALWATLVTRGPVPRTSAARAQRGDSDCVAIEDVTVLSTVPDSAPRPRMSILIEGERIAAIEPSAEFSIPGHCTVVDGHGQWLMPGLTEMHTHFLSKPIPELDFEPEEILAPYFANGSCRLWTWPRRPSRMPSGTLLPLV